MARRKQFTQLIADLRAELGRGSDPALNVSDLASLKRTLQRQYESLYADYDWPHLNVIADRITLEAGQRYYDFPDNMDYDDVESVAVWWGGKPYPIERGIGFDEYSTYDSESDERADPALKWDVRYIEPKEMCEIWPVPTSNDQALQFVGRLKFTQLVDDADLCLIDGDLVVLSAAVELLPSKEVRAKLAALQKRYARAKGNSKSGSGTIRLGLGAAPQPAKAFIRIGR